MKLPAPLCLTTALLSLVVVWSCSKIDLPPLTAEEHAQAIKDVADLRAADAITRHDCTTHEAHVTPDTWQILDAVGKQSITLSLAVACATVGQTAPASITIIDSQSGKRLARVGPLGYSVE